MRYLCFVLAVLAAAWFRNCGDADSQIFSIENLSIPTLNKEFAKIVDQNGRELSCKLTAKRDNFVQIQREADGRGFVISLSTLSDASRKRFSRISDFNQEVVDVELLKLAGKEFQVELLYIPGISADYRSKCTGQRIKTSVGIKLDSYRDFLRNYGFKYKEVALQAEEMGNGGFVLPSGMKDIPCLRVGETLIYKRDREKIHEAMVEHYIAKYGS